MLSNIQLVRLVHAIKIALKATEIRRKQEAEQLQMEQQYNYILRKQFILKIIIWREYYIFQKN